MKKTNKITWKVKSSKIVHKNPFYSIVADEIVRQDGSKGTSYVAKIVNFTAIFAFEDNQVYLVGQYRHPIREYCWEIPEGRIDKNETPLAGAKRELLEETGLTAKKWDFLGKFASCNGHCSQLGYVYLAQNLKKVSQKLGKDEGEILELKKIPLSELKKLVYNGKITDAGTIIGLHYYLSYKKAKLKK